MPALTLAVRLAVGLVLGLSSAEPAARAGVRPLSEAMHVHPGASCIEEGPLEEQVAAWLGTHDVDAPVAIEVEGNDDDPLAVVCRITRNGLPFAERRFDPGPERCDHFQAVVGLAIALALRASVLDGLLPKAARPRVDAPRPQKPWAASAKAGLAVGVVPGVSGGLDIHLERLLPQNFSARLGLLGLSGGGLSIAGVDGSYAVQLVATVYWRVHRARKLFRQALSVLAPGMAEARAFRMEPARVSSHDGDARAGAIVFMAAAGGSGGEAEGLLRFAGGRPPVAYEVERGLARHRHLVTVGTPPPAWSTQIHAAPAFSGSTIAFMVAGGAVVAAAAVAHLHGAPGGALRVAVPALPTSVMAAEVRGRVPPVAPLSGAADIVPSSPPASAPEPSSSVAAVWEAAQPAPSPTKASDRAPWSARHSEGARHERAAIDPAHDAPSPPLRAAPPAPSRAERAATTTSAAPPEITDAQLLELRQLAAAERLVKSDPAHALSLVRADQARAFREATWARSGPTWRSWRFSGSGVRSTPRGSPIASSATTPTAPSGVAS